MLRDEIIEEVLCSLVIDYNHVYSVLSEFTIKVVKKGGVACQAEDLLKLYNWCGVHRPELQAMLLEQDLIFVRDVKTNSYRVTPHSLEIIDAIITVMRSLCYRDGRISEQMLNQVERAVWAPAGTYTFTAPEGVAVQSLYADHHAKCQDMVSSEQRGAEWSDFAKEQASKFEMLTAICAGTHPLLDVLSARPSNTQSTTFSQREQAILMVKQIAQAYIAETRCEVQNHSLGDLIQKSSIVQRSVTTLTALKSGVMQFGRNTYTQASYITGSSSPQVIQVQNLESKPKERSDGSGPSFR